MVCEVAECISIRVQITELYVQIIAMEVLSNYIRVRVDVSEVGVPFIKMAWVCVDRVILRTVKDFKQSLYKKFQLQEDHDISLYLQSCLLLEDESIFVLRDEDVIRVVYEDFKSSSSSLQCNVETFTSNSAKNFKRHRTVMKSITSLPVAKKIRAQSPIFAVQSAQDILDLDMSPESNRYGDLRKFSDIQTSKIESVRKKPKKHKNGRKEKNESKNFLSLEEGMNGCGSTTHESNVNNSDRLLILPEENIQKQMSEGDSYCRVTNSKKDKVKERPIVHLVTGINDNFLSKTETICAETGTNKIGSDDLCSEGTETGTNKIGSGDLCSEGIQKEVSSRHVCELASPKKFKTSEEKLPINTTVELEVEAYDSSKVLQDDPGLKEQSGKSQCDSDSMDLQNSQVSYFTTPTGSSNASVKHSSPKEILENVLCSELSSSFLQVVGDCTQSLGNNCPKKKRKRKRRKVPHCSAEPSGSNNASSSLSVLSAPSFPNSISEYNQVTNSHDRKHIRFLNSPENSPIDETLNGEYSVDSIENSTLAKSDASCATQESSKMNISSEHEAGSSFKDYVNQASSYQEEILPSSRSDVTSNCDSNLTLNKSEEVTDEPKSYANFPPLRKFPSVGDVIAYKILELGASYCPELSDYKEGKIVSVNTSTDELEIDLLEEQVIVRQGKFENIYPNEVPVPLVINKVYVPWSSLIVPKLISSGTK